MRAGFQLITRSRCLQKKKKTCSLAFEINEFYSYLIKSPFNSNNVTIPLPSAMGATKIICELDCKE